jgi:DNA-directed RNA polymerase specialized sigma24 family protein
MREHLSAVPASTLREAAGSDDARRRRAFEELTRVYWSVARGHIRMKWRRRVDEAEDLTQEFFATAFAKRYFDAYLPSRGRFTTFLRVCLDRFVANQVQAQRRQKRCWDREALTIPPDEAERAVAGARAECDIEASYDREWTRGLLEVGLRALRDDAVGSRRTLGLALFERVALGDGEAPSYAELASEHGVTVTDVNNHLARTRRRLRRILLDRLRDATGSTEEFRDEARAVLGVSLPRES